jgi:transposase
MNSFVFLEWFEYQLMPALKIPSLVVLDNASYHNVKTEDTVCPHFSQKKLFSKTILRSTTFPFLLLIP